MDSNQRSAFLQAQFLSCKIERKAMKSLAKKFPIKALAGVCRQWKDKKLFCVQLPCWLQ